MTGDTVISIHRTPKRFDEIRREEWGALLDGFNRQHRGRQVDLRFGGGGITGQIEAREVPLQGIRLDAGDAWRRISIEIGREERTALSHVVRSAAQLRVARTQTGSTAAIEIESTAGETTLLELHDIVEVT